MRKYTFEFRKQILNLSRSFRSFSSFIRRLCHHPKSQEIQGYHFGILCCAVISTVVFVINLTLTLWGYKHYGVTGGLGTIRVGNCNATKGLAIKLHLTINVLSSLLLGASNYTMQCLSAPTRQDIDECHKDKIWLNIGTSSMRNLRRIALRRVIMWLLVAISSVPLHLLYNSAVFTTLYARGYNVFLVAPSFMTGAEFDVGNNSVESTYGQYPNTISEGGAIALNARAAYLRDQQDSLEKLTKSDCLRIYSASAASNHGDVLVILESDYSYNLSDPVVAVWPFIEPDFVQTNYSSAIPWYCSDNILLKGGECDVYLQHPLAYNCTKNPITRNGNVAKCDTHDLIAHADSWQLRGRRIDRCIAAPNEERCKVQFSAEIMVVVIICNFCKLTIMGYVAWQRPLEPLVTVGDAVASFLDKPDRTTKSNCLVTKYRFEKATHHFNFSTVDQDLRPLVNTSTRSKKEVHCRRPSETRSPTLLYFNLRGLVAQAQREPIGPFLRHAHEEQLHRHSSYCEDEKSRRYSDGWNKRATKFAPESKRWFSAPGHIRWIQFISL